MFVFRYRIDLTFSQKIYEKIVRVVIDVKDSSAVQEPGYLDIST